jgi:hypothetical protein
VITLNLASDETWLSLIQGAIGSVLGLGGAVLVVLLTIRHDRVRDAQRAAAEQAERETERVAAAIADIATASSYVVRDVRHAPFFRITATTDLLAAVLRFVLVVNPDHPAVAEWALAQNQLLNNRLARYRRRWILPLGGNRRRDAWSQHLGQLGGRLVSWHTGTIDDEWFASELKKIATEGKATEEST